MKNKDIIPHNKKGKPHGYWEVYYSDDSVMYKCFYNNGKPVGYKEYCWSDNNELYYKKYYI